MKNDTTLDFILEKVCEHFNLSIEDVKSKRKYGNLPYARQIYFFIARKMTDCKLEWIGETVNKDHSNVIFSLKKITYEKMYYPETAIHLRKIWDLLFVPEIVIQDIDLLKITENYTNVVK